MIDRDDQRFLVQGVVIGGALLVGAVTVGGALGLAVRVFLIASGLGG